MKSLKPKWRGPIAAVVVLVVFIVAAVALGACGSSSSGGTSPSSAATPKPGGTFAWPLGSDPLGITPLSMQEADASTVTHQVFQSLYTVVGQTNATATAQPDLVEKTVMSPDAKTFTFTIKQGIKFAPPVNREVTAQDFVNSWNYVMNAKNGSAYAPYDFADIVGVDPNTGYAKGGKLSGLKVLSKYTFQVQLQKPFSTFALTMSSANAGVFPVDYANKVGKKAFEDKPVGTGPYMVKSWVHGTQITLVKNPNYWNTSHSGYSATPGYLDEIDYPIYHDAATQYLAFQKGTLGACFVPEGSYISSKQLANVKNGQWSVNLYDQASVQFIAFAMDKAYGSSALLPLRQALVYSADRNSVCKVGTQGVDLPSDLIVPLGMKGVVEGLNPYPYDPSKAQPLIAKLNASGVKIPTPIPYLYNTGYGADENAQILVAGWQKAMPSLTFKLSGMETASYWPALAKNQAPGLFRMGWVGDWPTLDDFIYLFSTTGGKTLSYSFYSNPEVDKVITQARGTIDQTQANNLYNEAQKLILADAPCIPLFTYRQPVIVNNKYGGFNFSPYDYPNLWQVWEK